MDAALASYEAARHPQVTRIQDAARPSLSWWEHFGRSYRSLPPWQFAFHFFSRSLPESKLRQRDAGFVESVHRAWSAAHGGAVDGSDPLRTPLDVAGGTQPHRVVPVTGGQVLLAHGPLPLLRPAHDTAPAGPDRGVRGWAPRTPRPAGPVPGGGGPRPGGGRQPGSRGQRHPADPPVVCEAARLQQGAVTLLVEDESSGARP